MALCLTLALAVVAAGLAGVPDARASVRLVSFTAVAQGDNTIKVEWKTATEIGTTGFLLYRATEENPGNWGGAIYSRGPASDGMVGATYTYVDGVDGNQGNVQAGVCYYYKLQELATDGGSWHGPVTAGIGVQCGLLNTPTATATATATGTSAATAQATMTPTASPTVTRTRVPTRAPTDDIAPTATRQFPNTNTPVPTATLNVGSAFDSGLATPFQVATPLPTVIGRGSVTTPTPAGGVPLPQAAAFAPPSATPAPALIAVEVTLTPTALTAALDPTVTPTLILRPQGNITRTPEVFEPSAGRRVTPEAVEETRNATAPFMFGGGAIVLAALLGAGGYAIWRSRRR